jgi:hypothetical protein
MIWADKRLLSGWEHSKWLSETQIWDQQTARSNKSQVRIVPGHCVCVFLPYIVRDRQRLLLDTGLHLPYSPLWTSWNVKYMAIQGTLKREKSTSTDSLLLSLFFHVQPSPTLSFGIYVSKITLLSWLLASSGKYNDSENLAILVTNLQVAENIMTPENLYFQRHNLSFQLNAWLSRTH